MLLQIINQKGFEAIAEEIAADPLQTFDQFPFIGPITQFHLAKNLGIPVAKSDRHVSRLAACCGYGNVQEFCGNIALLTGDPIDVVDTLRRFATITAADYPRFALMAGVRLLCRLARRAFGASPSILKTVQVRRLPAS